MKQGTHNFTRTSSFVVHQNLHGNVSRFVEGKNAYKILKKQCSEQWMTECLEEIYLKGQSNLAEFEKLKPQVSGPGSCY
jgi:hypothetical protein